MLARIWQCVSGARDAVNGGFGEEELLAEIGLWWP